MDKKTPYKNARRFKPGVETPKFTAKKLDQCSNQELAELHFIEYPFVCEFCCLMFPTKRKYTYHCKSTHSNVVQAFICDWCKKLFSRRDSLKRHSRNIHFFEEEKFTSMTVRRNPKHNTEPPKTKTLINKMSFKIIQDKNGQVKLKPKPNHKTDGQPEPLTKPPMDGTDRFLMTLPPPISPLPPTPTYSTIQLDSNLSASSSTSTICEDEYLMHSDINEQIIEVSRIYGLFNAN